MANRLRFLLAIVLVALAWAGTSVAFAHAELRESYPPAGAAYRWERPQEIRLRFTQEVNLEGSSIQLVNRQFQPQSTGVLQQDPNDKTILFVTLPQLPTATYTVNWVTSSVDGHTIQGSYDFTLLPREPVITTVIAVVGFTLFGAFVLFKRAR